MDNIYINGRSISNLLKMGNRAKTFFFIQYIFHIFFLGHALSTSNGPVIVTRSLGIFYLSHAMISDGTNTWKDSAHLSRVLYRVDFKGINH